MGQVQSLCYCSDGGDNPGGSAAVEIVVVGRELLLRVHYKIEVAQVEHQIVLKNYYN